VNPHAGIKQVAGRVVARSAIAQSISQKANNIMGDLTSGARLVNNVAKYGTKVLTYTQAHGREGLLFLDKMVSKFPGTTFSGIGHSWSKPTHNAEWRNLGVTSETKVQEIVSEVIESGRIGIYKQYNSTTKVFEGDRFGFLKSVQMPNGQVKEVFVASYEHGEIVTAYPSSTRYFESQDLFFELVR